MGSMVKFLGWPTPAAEMAEFRPDGVEYCMYQVPIITIAYLPDTTMGESFDCQLLPSALAMAGSRLTASGAYVSTDPLAAPGATSKTSGPTVEASAGRSAAL